MNVVSYGLRGQGRLRHRRGWGNGRGNGAVLRKAGAAVAIVDLDGGNGCATYHATKHGVIGQAKSVALPVDGGFTA